MALVITLVDMELCDAKQQKLEEEKAKDSDEDELFHPDTVRNALKRFQTSSSCSFCTHLLADSKCGTRQA